jgi:hypothetical protein
MNLLPVCLSRGSMIVNSDENVPCLSYYAIGSNTRKM